jgi:DnaJ-domain-containing protein 1
MPFIITLILTVICVVIYIHAENRNDEAALAVANIQALVRLAISAAKADGPVNAQERDAILRHHGGPQLVTSFYAQVENDDVAPEYAARIFRAITDGPGARHVVMRTLLYVLCADGELAAQELDWLGRLCSANHICDEEVQDAVGFYFGRQNTDAQRSKWAAVLDIDPNADVDTIKRAYHDKARQLHPDTLPGVNETVRRLAEDKLKEVNDAYEHLLEKSDDPEEIKGMFALDGGNSWRPVEGLTQGSVVVCTCCHQQNRLPSRAKFYGAKCGHCHCYLLLTARQRDLTRANGVQFAL